MQPNQTTFEKIAGMNAAFGNPPGFPSNPDWGRLEKQLRNVPDECVEAESAIAARDLTLLIDACADIIVFTFGIMHLAGVNGDRIMDAVYTSNMSKFCRDEAELSATRAKYDALGVKYEVEGEFPVAFLRCTEDVLVGKDQYRAKKFLKGVNYKEPVLTLGT